MDKSAHFRINIPKVIHETIDGETVIVNLDSGNYFSLDRVGVDIWTLIGANTPLHQIVDDIASRYIGKQKEIEHAVHQFVDALQQDDLIVSDESQRSGSEGNPGTQDGTEQFKERCNFEAPVLYKYTDMQDLLLLDPIHDVDETGWPSAKNDLPAGNK